MKYKYLLMPLVFISQVAFAFNEIPCSKMSVPILLYHRFNDAVSDSMTVKVSTFETHLKILKEQKYTVIPLQTVIECRTGKRETLPEKSVVIVTDDGHKSVYTRMKSIVLRDKIPVTLFIYPSAISNASYAMTWGEVEELQKTGLFDIQSHTFWHPNFKQERKRLSPEEFVKFTKNQFTRSKEILEKRSNHSVDMLAWPFGIYDSELMKLAGESGYKFAYSIDAAPVTQKSELLSLPRYLIEEPMGAKWLNNVLLNSQGIQK